jgi:hypothetical protein
MRSARHAGQADIYMDINYFGENILFQGRGNTHPNIDKLNRKNSSLVRFKGTYQQHVRIISLSIL